MSIRVCQDVRFKGVLTEYDMSKLNLPNVPMQDVSVSREVDEVLPVCGEDKDNYADALKSFQVELPKTLGSCSTFGLTRIFNCQSAAPVSSPYSIDYSDLIADMKKAESIDTLAMPASEGDPANCASQSVQPSKVKTTAKSLYGNRW